MKTKSCKWLTVQSLDGKEAQDFPASQVAKRTGYDLRTVERWCNGQPIPRPARLLLACLMLGCIPADGWARWRAGAGTLRNLTTGQAYDAGMLEKDWVRGSSCQKLAAKLKGCATPTRLFPDSLANWRRRGIAFRHGIGIPVPDRYRPAFLMRLNAGE